MIPTRWRGYNLAATDRGACAQLRRFYVPQDQEDRLCGRRTGNSPQTRIRISGTFDNTLLVRTETCQPDGFVGCEIKRYNYDVSGTMWFRIWSRERDVFIAANDDQNHQSLSSITRIFAIKNQKWSKDLISEFNFAILRLNSAFYSKRKRKFLFSHEIQWKVDRWKFLPPLFT